MGDFDDEPDISHKDFWERFRSFILWIVMQMGVDENSANDLVQEIAIRTGAYWHTRQIRSLRGTRAWVRQIARRMTLDYLEANGNNVNHLEDHTDMDVHQRFIEGLKSREALPDDAVANEEIQQLLWGVISALPLEDRQLLGLRYLYKMKFREIAEVMGISTAAATKRHQRMLDDLYELLKDSGLSSDDFDLES